MSRRKRQASWERCSRWWKPWITSALYAAASTAAASCSRDDPAKQNDIRVEAKSLQNWAQHYGASAHLALFNGTVAIDSDNATFHFVANDSSWNRLDTDERDAIITKTINATQAVFCLQPDNRNHMVVVVVQIVGLNDTILGQKVSGASLRCSSR